MAVEDEDCGARAPRTQVLGAIKAMLAWADVRLEPNLGLAAETKRELEEESKVNS